MTLGTENGRSDGKYEHVIGKSVQLLADRYDPAAVAPPLEARVRMVCGVEAHDALVDAGGARIVTVDGDRPDAVITGPASAWRSTLARRATSKTGATTRSNSVAASCSNRSLASGLSSTTA